MVWAITGLCFFKTKNRRFSNFLWPMSTFWGPGNVHSAQQKQWFYDIGVLLGSCFCVAFLASVFCFSRHIFRKSFPFTRKTTLSRFPTNLKKRIFFRWVAYIACACSAVRCFRPFFSLSEFSENGKKWNPSRFQGIRVFILRISPVYKENVGSRTSKKDPPMRIIAVYKENHTLGPKCCWNQWNINKILHSA